MKVIAVIDLIFRNREVWNRGWFTFKIDQQIDILNQRKLNNKFYKYSWLKKKQVSRLYKKSFASCYHFPVTFFFFFLDKTLLTLSVLTLLYFEKHSNSLTITYVYNVYKIHYWLCSTSWSVVRDSVLANSHKILMHYMFKRSGLHHDTMYVTLSHVINIMLPKVLFNLVWITMFLLFVRAARKG